MNQTAIVGAAMNEVAADETLTLDQKIAKVQCYIQNVDELLQDFRDKFIDTSTGDIKKMDFKQGVSMLQTVYENAKETLFECEKKDIAIQLPNNLYGQVITAILSLLGIKL